jgi:hypothetical protein
MQPAGAWRGGTAAARRLYRGPMLSHYAQFAAAWWGQGGEAPQSVPRPSAHRYPLAPDSQRDRLAHRPHGNDTASALVRRKLERLLSCGGCGCRGLPAPTELAAIGPHAMQDQPLRGGGRAGEGRCQPMKPAIAMMCLDASGLCSTSHPLTATLRPVAESSARPRKYFLHQCSMMRADIWHAPYIVQTIMDMIPINTIWFCEANCNLSPASQPWRTARAE